MQNDEPITDDACISYWQYKTQSELNAEMLLELRIEMQTMHSKIDLILEALRK